MGWQGETARIHFAGAFYHVIARGHGGEKVFREDGDCRFYLKPLKEYKKRFGYDLCGYALMPSHVHRLIETVETALSKVMQYIVAQNIQCLAGERMAAGITYEIPIFEISESFMIPRNPFTRSINL